MKLLITQCFPVSHYYVSLKSKFLPQHPIHKQPQAMFFLYYEIQIFIPT